MEEQELKRKNAQRKLEKLRKKAQKKVLKYQKKLEKIRRRAEKKAKKYASLERELIIAAKPQVGDPILPADGLIQENGENVQMSKAEIERSKRQQKKMIEEKRKEEQKRIARGDFTMFERFELASFEELESRQIKAATREERIFYRTVLNLKLQMEQEKVIGEELL